MRAWPDTTVPTLPGRGSRPLLYDTATGLSRPVPALVREAGGDVRVYVCGITPYDATHLGHAATYLAFDTLGRVLTDAGFRVRLVQNVTDVDEPLLERAGQTGEDWAALAERETDLFRSDMTALRVRPPEAFVGAVESIPLITADITRLLAAGAAYDLNGDVYFAVGSDAAFGEVAHLDTATMRRLSAQNGGDPDRPGKKDPLDPLVWRAQRPGEPAWDSPFGRGRPGWHLECTAISLDRLPGAGVGQPSVDVQGGGSDLVFPHHEMCAAQARVLTGAPFADTYVHGGLVGLDGHKMSKSRGNLVFVSRLLADGVDPAAIRLALLAGHHRQDRPWTPELLSTAEARLAAWRVALARPSGPAAGPLLDQVRARLADDLDTPGALAAVDAWASAGSSVTPSAADDASGPALAADVLDALLGVPASAHPASAHPALTHPALTHPAPAQPARRPTGPGSAAT